MRGETSEYGVGREKKPPGHPSRDARAVVSPVRSEGSGQSFGRSWAFARVSWTTSGSPRSTVIGTFQ